MLMTGSDDRTVAAIEKLTKQKFELRTLAVATSGRPERGERRDRAPRRESQPTPPRVATPAFDDFFSKPYEPTGSTAGAVPAPQPSTPAGAAKPTRVAALLGGIKR